MRYMDFDQAIMAVNQLSDYIENSFKW